MIHQHTCSQCGAEIPCCCCEKPREGERKCLECIKRSEDCLKERVLPFFGHMEFPQFRIEMR